MPYSHPAKILLIDDETEFCLALKEYLDSEGYAVRSAGDGKEGIETFRSFRPDLVLLDVRMPRLGGLMALKTLRGESSVPVIMLTAVGELEIARECLKIGAESYMTKPIDLDDLRNCISHTLKCA